MISHRTFFSHAHLPSLPSLRISRTRRDPCCRPQNCFQSLPRRPVDSGLGEIFGVRGPRPVVEDPEVKLRHVQARGPSPSLICDLLLALPRADGRPALVAQRVVAAWRAAAHRTCRELGTTPAPGFLPGCRRGGRGDVPRAASLSASHALHGPTVGRGCRRVGWLQHQHLQLTERSVKRRYR